MNKVVPILLFACSFSTWAADGPPAVSLPNPPSSMTTARQDWWKPYSPPCVEREDVFEFVDKPAVKKVGDDKYEIAFAVKGNCDVTVGMIDEKGGVVRHLGSGVLGSNAPAPFQKNSLRQTLIWNGKDDLNEYVKNPQALRVRVMLGLKPEFDKLLGWSPYDVTGSYLALAADEKGVLALSEGNAYARPQLRRYDHDGNYVATVFPPSATMPYEKMKGLEVLEYEPGRKTIHSLTGAESLAIALSKAPPQNSSVSGYGAYLPPAGAPAPQQPCISQGWFIYVNTGHRTKPVWLHRMRADNGASDDVDYAWMAVTRNPDAPGYFKEFTTANVRLAASPDGKWIYLSGLEQASARNWIAGVYRVDATKRDAMGRKPFVGLESEPGNDNAHFNQPDGIDCDAQGRLYVCDSLNNRIQVFSPAGEYVRTLPLSRPHLILIDRARGIPYVVHEKAVRGVSGWHVTRLKSLESAEETSSFSIVSLMRPKNVDRDGRVPLPLSVEKYGDKIPLFALDVWSNRPRVWVTPTPSRLFVLEDAGDSFTVVRDFQEDVEKAGLPPGAMLARFPKVTADPTMEKLYYYGAASSCSRDAMRFDMKTGAVEPILFPCGYGDFGPDIAFDKRGYILTHVTGMVMRHNPDRMIKKTTPGNRTIEVMDEVPLDFGTVGENLGAVATRDQGCAKGYQDGFGVNMRGDFVVESNIGFVPKMQDEAKSIMGENQGAIESYAAFLRKIDDSIRRGEDLFSVPPQPGIRLAGGTFWVYDRSGEARAANVVKGLGIVHGAQIDEDDNIYLAIGERKVVGGRPFLAGRATRLGSPDVPSNPPFTGSLVKVSPKGARMLTKGSPIKLEPAPAGLVHFAGSDKSAGPDSWMFDMANRGYWGEGFEWVYAGASPIVPGGCSCSNMRIHTDWFKRTFVPEAYRHSVGVVDTAGNLIMHIGQYGNADSGRGSDSPVKVGGDEIAFSHVQYVSGTDNYLCLSDCGNVRLVLLKLNYHAEETAGIR